MPKARPAIERFWEKVDKAGPIPPHRPELGPCWLWTASCNESGYGWFGVDGRSGLVHRWAWMTFVGPIPADKPNVLHHCDNPPCVNYEGHLFVGTQAENLSDMFDKGRDGHPPIMNPCGTASAYTRHRYRGEVPCEACRLAHNAYQRDLYARRER